MYQEIVAKIPRGDWLRAGHWRTTPLYERHPVAVECAMETLATLATPDWFFEEAKKWCTIANGDRVSSHPIVLGMLHPDYLSFWPVFCLGNDLHTLDNVRPIPSRSRELPLAERLLDSAEFRGAAGEVSAAARLKRSGVRFEWYPPEGGDFSIQGDATRFVEVKRRSYVSETATSELNKYHELRATIAAAVPGYEAEFALEPMQADGLGTRARNGTESLMNLSPRDRSWSSRRTCLVVAPDRWVPCGSDTVAMNSWQSERAPAASRSMKSPKLEEPCGLPSTLRSANSRLASAPSSTWSGRGRGQSLSWWSGNGLAI